MQCVTPMFREYEIRSKKTIRIVPRMEILEEMTHDQNLIRFKLSKFNAKSLEYGRLTQMIPCGHCYACKLTKSAEMASRSMLETLESPYNYFVTLTYDEENVPIAESMIYKQEIENGEIKEIEFKNVGDEIWCTGTLIPDEMTKFMKDLRRYFEYHYNHHGIRFYLAGEYGTENKRPHYHLLLFNCPIPIEENYDTYVDENKKMHWKNRVIEEIWEHKGIIDIGEIEFSSAAYVARYCQKKIFNNTKTIDYYASGKEPEFNRMSRRPGIGMNYYKLNKAKIYENDEIIMKTLHGNVAHVKIKSFDRLFKEEFPEQFEKIQKRRKELADKTRKLSYTFTDLTDLEMLRLKEENVTTKSNMLKREL